MMSITESRFQLSEAKGAQKTHVEASTFLQTQLEGVHHGAATLETVWKSPKQSHIGHHSIEQFRS